MLVIGHVGRFSYAKNHVYLLEIFKKILEKKDAILMMVGDGKLKTEIESKIKQMNLENNVVLTGIRKDVEDMLQVMDVFVMPSKYEGLGIVAIEAQTSGLPCVVSDGVSKECKQTDLFVQIPLSKEPDFWADEILRVSGIRRIDKSKIVKSNGYDLEENVTKLTDYYIKRIK